jgi:hypothetical protein
MCSPFRSDMFVYMCPKSQALTQAAQVKTAKPNSTCRKESESVHNQSNQQKGVTRSVYYEHGDRMDQFAPEPVAPEDISSSSMNIFKREYAGRIIIKTIQHKVYTCLILFSVSYAY